MLSTVQQMWQRWTQQQVAHQSWMKEQAADSQLPRELWEWWRKAEAVLTDTEWTSEGVVRKRSTTGCLQTGFSSRGTFLGGRCRQAMSVIRSREPHTGSDAVAKRPFCNGSLLCTDEDLRLSIRICKISNGEGNVLCWNLGWNVLAQKSICVDSILAGTHLL
jgi:hypothetical protein